MFTLAPGVRHLSLPWLWLLTGSVSEPCALAVGEGDHEGVFALALNRGAGRGYAVSGALGGTADLGAGPAAGSIAGLYNGEPVVTDGSRFLFKSHGYGWCVSTDLAEPSEWEETTNTYAVVDGTAQLVASTTETKGSAFWTGSPPGFLGVPATFSPRGSLKDGGSPVSVSIDAALSRRSGSWGQIGSGISGAYGTLSGGGAGISEIGAFAPAIGAAPDYVYQAARLL